MAFKSQGAAVLAAFQLVTGTSFTSPVVLEADARMKIATQLLKWFNEGEWSIKSDRCNKGDGLIAYIGGDPKKAMKCNIIDNFLTRTPESKAKAAPAANDPLATIKAALAAGLITPDQAASAALKLIVG